jgi:hypothetical protein
MSVGKVCDSNLDVSRNRGRCAGLYVCVCVCVFICMRVCECRCDDLMICVPWICRL